MQFSFAEAVLVKPYSHHAHQVFCTVFMTIVSVIVYSNLAITDVRFIGIYFPRSLLWLVLNRGSFTTSQSSGVVCLMKDSIFLVRMSHVIHVNACSTPGCRVAF